MLSLYNFVNSKAALEVQRKMEQLEAQIEELKEKCEDAYRENERLENKNDWLESRTIDLEVFRENCELTLGQAIAATDEGRKQVLQTFLEEHF